MSHTFTIGVEEEFQIVDPATCELRSHAVKLHKLSVRKHIVGETRAQIET
jgi:hypothetical protein